MLKHLPQLMKFKTAMDVRIGLPNEHLAGSGRNEINQPMYATSVGLIMKGFEFLEMYKKTFDAGTLEEYVVKPKTAAAEKVESDMKQEETGSKATPEETMIPEKGEGRISFADRLKVMVAQIFEIEDQNIN